MWIAGVRDGKAYLRSHAVSGMSALNVKLAGDSWATCRSGGDEWNVLQAGWRIYSAI